MTDRKIDPALADRIKRIVDGSPPLTEEELAKLAVLLHPGVPYRGGSHAPH